MKKFICLFGLIFAFFLIGCEPEEGKKEYFKDFITEYEGRVGENVILPEKSNEEKIVYSSESKMISIENNVILLIQAGDVKVKGKCGSSEIEIKINIQEEIKLVVNTESISILKDESFEIDAHLENGEGTIEYTTTSKLIIINDNIVTGNNIGNGIIKVIYKDQKKEIPFEIKDSIVFSVEEMSLFVEEEKELKVNVELGNSEEIVITSLTDNLEVKDNKTIIGITTGEGKIKVKLGYKEIEVIVIVKANTMEVLNENFEIDILDEVEIKVDYPKHLQGDLTYTIYNENVLKVENGIIYPLNEGTTKIKIQLGDYRKVSQIILVNIVVDPIKIISLLHINDVMMKKEITTYGSVERKQMVMGSVSKYLFEDLNLKQQIINIYPNDYEGQKATEELLKIVEPLKLPRTGIKLESISYITYHDTGNNTQGAASQGNVNYMLSSDSINYRARSWHYTVDSNQVIQTLPDDEVGWHGDAYGAYAQSIGIETCVDFGCNLHKVWQRMGKLCAKLMKQYRLDISCIKQHYEWSGKECPQTLRRNNLYNYALGFVEGELIVLKALSRYNIEFESLTPEYLNSSGLIIKNPTEKIQVSYKVTITNGAGYNESIILTSEVNPAS